MYLCVCMICGACVRACCIAISIYKLYIIGWRRRMWNVSVNVNAALPSVGSVVSRDMTHAITGRRGALYQLLAIATTRGGPRHEIQRVPPHIHTAPNNINTIRHSQRDHSSLVCLHLITLSYAYAYYVAQWMPAHSPILNHKWRTCSRNPMEKWKRSCLSRSTQSFLK